MSEISKSAATSNKPRKETLVLNYEPLSEKHRNFHKAHNISTRILGGAVGSGKSRSAAADIIIHLLTEPKFIGKRALVAGITTSHLRQLLIPEFKKILTWQDSKGRNRGFIEGKHYKVTLHPNPTIEFWNGSIIQFVSLESGINLRGYNVSIVYADDIGETDSETWDALVDRAYREEDGVGYIVGTLNPGNKFHWCYKRWFELKENGTLNSDMVYVDSLTMYDNPSLKAKWPIMEQQYSHDNVAFRRKILGEFCSQEGLVYSKFDPSKHVLHLADKNVRDRLDEAIRDGSSYCGLDFGAHDATVCLWVTKYQDRFYVYKEYYADVPSTPISKHCEFIKRQREHVVKIYSDTYTESINTYRENGVKLQIAQKGNGAKTAGLALINQLFEDDRLYISEDCKNLIREVSNYAWLTNSNRDMPKDGNDDTCDALRYCLFEIASGANRIYAFASADEKNQQDGNKLHTLSVKPVNIYIEHQQVAESMGAILMGYEKDGKPVYAFPPGKQQT